MNEKIMMIIYIIIVAVWVIFAILQALTIKSMAEAIEIDNRLIEAQRNLIEGLHKQITLNDKYIKILKGEQHESIGIDKGTNKNS